jgi:HEAT repeat protein
MITFGRSLIQFSWSLAFALCAMIVLLAGFVLLRRAFHFLRTFRKSPNARLIPLIDAMVTGSADYQAGLLAVRGDLRRARRLALDKLPLAEADPDPARIANLRRLCSDLGLVCLWRSQLRRASGGWTLSDLFRPGVKLIERIPGLSFVARAEAAENLGIVSDAASWTLLAETLDDPHLTVRSVAARALARIKEPASFAALVRKLQSVALGEGRGISVRCLRMALSRYPVRHAAELSGMLQHPHGLIRLQAADVIATMVGRAGSSGSIPGSIVEIFLQRLIVDRNPEVRARAADVIGHVDDLWAGPALALLLEDAEWFVRLHATRALVNHASAPVEALNRRLIDSNWRVREAAVQTLAGQGRDGMRSLLAHFLKTQDRYSREQVAEQIERTGLIPSVLKAFGDPGAAMETRFITGLVRMGRTAALRTALQNGLAWKRTVLLAELRRDADSKARAFTEAVLRMPPAGLVERLDPVPVSEPALEERISA